MFFLVEVRIRVILDGLVWVRVIEGFVMYVRVEVGFVEVEFC